MGINIRQKGQEGEREIQRALEPIIRKVMTDGGFPLPDKPIVQRNQNQSNQLFHFVFLLNNYF